MSASGNDDVMESFFQAALAARQETFLAHYPRKLKLGIVGLVLFFVAALLVSSLGTQSENASSGEEPALSEALFTPNEHNRTSNGTSQETAPPLAKRLRETHSAPTNETERLAIERNDSLNPTALMAHAPDMSLVENTPDGPLPRISEDGRKPWQVYARPYDQADPRPRIAIVMMDMGLSKIATDAALRRLPPNVSMAFDLQGDNIAAWLDRARSDGHETLLSLPMEPTDYPRSDPGPNTLLTFLPNDDNAQRLLGALKKGTGYVGVTSLSGSRFTSDPGKVEPILQVLRHRGLLVFDARAGLQSVWGDLAAKEGVAAASASRMIDATATPQAIDAALSEIEKTARVQGWIVVTATPLPITLSHLETWIKGLPERGISLAPLSAVVE